MMSAPRAQFAALEAVADAAVDGHGAEVGEAREIAEGGLDLGGEFAGGLEDQDAGCGRGRRGGSRTGRAKAAVLPVPVWAEPMRSRPDRTMGMARSWMGVGSM